MSIKHVSLTITNPTILNLGLTKLSFTFDGTPGTQLFLDNVQCPGLGNGGFTNFDNNWFSEGHGYVELAASVTLPCSELTTLTAEQTGGTLALSWPITATNYVMEASASLNPPSWSPVTNSVSTTTNRFTVSVPTGETSRFYRLRLQCD